MINTVTVVGSGTMGNGIAHCFAQFGYNVRLMDSSAESLERGLHTVRLNLERQVAKAAIDETLLQSTIARITTFTDLAESVQGAQLVIEAATEDRSVKLDLFRKLSGFCQQGTLLASNTSSIPITELAAATASPEFVAGMHFMNPVPVMKLVEVIKGKHTSPETVNHIMEIAVSLGKVPVEVNDFPGFVANRILMPMINEAIYALYEGVAGVREIDTVMKLGMSHPMGPLQLADFIGLDVCLAIMEVLYEGFQDSKYQPCPLLFSMVKAGEKGVKTGLGFYSWQKGVKEPTVSGRFLCP